MAARFERLFDEWDHDTDISMVDLGTSLTDEHPLSPTTPSSKSTGGAHTRARSSVTSMSHRESVGAQLLPSYDDLSTKTLLRKESELSTIWDSFRNEQVESVSDGTRYRSGFRSNVQQLWHRKSVVSTRTTATFDGHFAHGKPGWWKKQMLVDRSLRSMAGFTALCCVVMFTIVFSYLKDFSNRINFNTTSVGGKDGESCASMERKNVATHLFINIAATMILGCSNTYQQLVTALKVDEIRWVLSKRGDSKVGTNSPWAINHKRDGKIKAWLAWILLISTSVPVHFLANSVVGPSFYIHMPTTIKYTKTDSSDSHSGPGSGSQDANDAACWTAFRANSYVLPQRIGSLSIAYNTNKLGNSTTYRSVEVFYSSSCNQYKDTTDPASAINEYNHTYYITGDRYAQYEIGNCNLGSDIYCKLSDEQPKQCRENVRMQAAFILAGCLFIKAVYMIMLNYRARGKTKGHCLTYGDVIVASVLDSDLKVKNECLLNSGDGYRHKVAHICHKHCKDPVSSKSGDDIGHCQKCPKFNEVDMSADLPHPSIAIKYKRSLLSNLGSTAVSQMLILTFCSMAMLGASIYLLLSMIATSRSWHQECGKLDQTPAEKCIAGLAAILKESHGTWGGFSSSATLAALPADSLGSEFLAFAISNGAQSLYSLLYLLLVYNLTLISMEHEWGAWETKRKKPRCTIVSGRQFEQSYFLQLPSRLIIPLMVYASLMHWLLGQAISTTETIYTDPLHKVEHSIYFVTYASYPIFMSTILMISMTAVCWWAFTYTREGFIPQMYGSIRACCASTSDLTDFNPDGIIWGDLGSGATYRHAGFSSDEPGKIIPAELYCGRE